MGSTEARVRSMRVGLTNTPLYWCEPGWKTVQRDTSTAQLTTLTNSFQEDFSPKSLILFLRAAGRRPLRACGGWSDLLCEVSAPPPPLAHPTPPRGTWGAAW